MNKNEHHKNKMFYYSKRPIKQGKWLTYQYAVDNRIWDNLWRVAYYCSECGYKPNNLTNFCPNCGAIMYNGLIYNNE